MKIKELKVEGNTLKIITEDYEEPVFYLLKSFLETKKDIDFVGVAKDHYLKEETELYVKFKKAEKIKDKFKKYVKELIKDLDSKKVK